MNLISNNDHISTLALHGPNIQHDVLGWIKHRYLRREGTPGKYRYIYPEDLKSRRAARNDSGATLFGDRQKRASFKTWSSQEKRLERQQSRTQKQLDKATRRVEYYSARQSDPTLKPSQRRKFALRQARAQAAAKALTSKMSEIKYYRGRVQLQRLAAQSKYDRSRTIDDVPANIADIGRAFVAAAVRRSERRATKNSQARGSHGLIRGVRILRSHS